MQGANLEKAVCVKTIMHQANLCDANMTEANLVHVGLNQATCRKTNFQKATMRYAYQWPGGWPKHFLSFEMRWNGLVRCQCLAYRCVSALCSDAPFCTAYLFQIRRIESIRAMWPQSRLENRRTQYRSLKGSVLVDIRDITIPSSSSPAQAHAALGHRGGGAA